MAMLLFLFLIFFFFLIVLYFVLMKIVNPVDKQVRSSEYKRKNINSVKHDITVKEREIDSLSRSTTLQEKRKQAEQELKELKKITQRY